MENRNNKEFDELSDFNNKYKHYVENEVEQTQSVNEIAEFEDITSYSEGNADFYMQPKAETSDELVANSVEFENYEHDNMKKKNKGNFFTRNKYRNLKIIALLLVICILLVFLVGLAYIYIVTGKGNYGDSGLDFNDPMTGQVIYEDDHNWSAMGDVDANSLNGFLYEWANNNGEKMYSKNVINVLLCGVDSETGTATSGRSDIMMLVSINKKTETITLVSLLRDSWTYMSLPKSDGSYYDYYFKLNSAYNFGGPTTLLNTIENNYKIEIDQFIAVDFASFPKLIDALGGVTVEVQNYEANYIRRTSSQKDFPYGKATLNGKQALIYSRIRKCDADSDISRTRRQRSIIKALVDSAKSASNGQLLNAFKQVSPYLRTGYTQSEVFALIAQAYTNGWMNYDMVEIVLPSEDFVDRASTKINGHWAWVADYAYCARKLQVALYGETNIILSDDRKSVLDLVTNRNTGGNSGSSGNSGTSSSHTSEYTPTEDNEDTTSSTQSTEPTENKPGISFPTLPGVSIPSISIPGIGNSDNNTGNDSDNDPNQTQDSDDSEESPDAGGSE